MYTINFTKITLVLFFTVESDSLSIIVILLAGDTL